MVYAKGSRVCLKNVDGMQLNAEVMNVLYLDEGVMFVVKLETGLVTWYTQKELDEMVVFDW